MSQRVKVLVSVVVVVALLTVGGTATVMAQDESIQEEPVEEEPVQEEPELAPSSGANGLLDKVAEILGISREELVNAFEQAQQEMGEEAFISYLDKAVEKGLITQDEADEIADWWLNRPEAVGRPVLRARIFRAIRCRQQIAASDGALRRGAIIEEQANRIGERWQNRLEALDRPLPRTRIFKAVRSRQQIAVPRVWGGPGALGLAD